MKKVYFGGVVMARFIARDLSEQRSVTVVDDTNGYTDTTMGYVRREEREFNIDVGVEEYGSVTWKVGMKFTLDGVEWEVIKVLEEV